jgi:hypothetical protein
LKEFLSRRWVHSTLLFFLRKPALQVAVSPPLKHLVGRQLVSHCIGIQPPANLRKFQVQESAVIVS